VLAGIISVWFLPKISY